MATLTKIGEGIFQHDILRHFVITRHTDEELRSLQQSVVDDLLGARPKKGFVMLADTLEQPNTLEHYVARCLWYLPSPSTL